MAVLFTPGMDSRYWVEVHARNCIHLKVAVPEACRAICTGSLVLDPQQFHDQVVDLDILKPVHLKCAISAIHLTYNRVRLPRMHYP